MTAYHRQNKPSSTYRQVFSPRSDPVGNMILVCSRDTCVEVPFAVQQCTDQGANEPGRSIEA